MADFKVFYSWQSDLPNKTNRGFIGDALAKACKEVEQNPEIEESPRVDQDTQGLPGAPSIPQAIMEKIDTCQVFVADVSLCYRTAEGTPGPNPNVAYELGYAVARLGWDRIILIVNTEFGAIENLPFDLEKRRALGYSAKESETDRSEAKKSLAGRLVKSIEVIAKRQPIVTRVTPTAAARDAIVSQSPDRILRIREFQRWLLDSIQELDPGLIDAIPWVEALPATIPLMEAFSTVVEGAVVVDDNSCIKEIWRGLEAVLARYDLPPRFQGSYSELQFDWWKFHGHEMCVIICAHLCRERKLTVLGSLLDEGFVQRRWAESRNYSQAGFRDLCAYLEYLNMWNEALKHSRKSSGWISPHGEILRTRYEPGSQLLVDWSAFIEADLLLALLSHAKRFPASPYSGWINFTYVYLKVTPAFVQSARTPSYARELMELFGAIGFPQLSEWLLEWWEELNQSQGRHAVGAARSIPVEAIKAIGGSS